LHITVGSTHITDTYRCPINLSSDTVVTSSRDLLGGGGRGGGGGGGGRGEEEETEGGVSYLMDVYHVSARVCGKERGTE
jgi:hypothetical protein